MESLGLVVVPNDDAASDGNDSELDDVSDDENLGGDGEGDAGSEAPEAAESSCGTEDECLSGTAAILHVHIRPYQNPKHVCHPR